MHIINFTQKFFPVIFGENKTFTLKENFFTKEF